MMRRDWQQRRALKRLRVDSGYTHARISRETHKRVKELIRKLGHTCSGADELIYELVDWFLRDPTRIDRVK